MRLFHRTSKESETSILRDGFKDRADPTGTNLGFYNQIPEIKAVWFSDFPLGANEGISSEKWTGSLNGDEGRLLLLEIPDEVVQQLDATVRMGLWGAVPWWLCLTFQKSLKKANSGGNILSPPKWRTSMARRQTSLTAKKNIHRIGGFSSGGSGPNSSPIADS